MKVVILCGGKGLRMRGGNDEMPKPMALVKDKPILWHIMKAYSNFGFNEFILPLGYKGGNIKEYFVNYKWRNSSFTTGFNKETIEYHDDIDIKDWKITFVDTGLETMTGGRVKRIEKYIDGDTFMLTYGDGLSNINIGKLLEFHNEKGKIATVTAVERKSQYGILKVKDGIVESFDEKTKLDGLINGGFFVLNRRIFNYLDGDSCIFEKEPLRKLVKEGELSVYKHNGYWKAIDTLKDLKVANETW
ncbi:sugar phosphate nucleotidyltransferase [Clostridium sp. DL1XJH146]